MHDVSPLVLRAPAGSPEWTSVTRRWRRQRPLFSNATAVVAVSKWSADRGIEMLGLDPKRVHVIHHGVEPAFHPATVPAADPPFLLLVSEFDPRKGYDVAMEVVARLADDGRPHQLKIVGRIAP